MNARNSFQTIFSELKQIMLDLYSSRRQNDKYYLLSITKYMKLRFLPFRRHPFQNGEIRNLRQVSWEFYLAKGIFMILIQEESLWRGNLQRILYLLTSSYIESRLIMYVTCEKPWKDFSLYLEFLRSKMEGFFCGFIFPSQHFRCVARECYLLIQDKFFFRTYKLQPFIEDVWWWWWPCLRKHSFSSSKWG